MSHVLQPAAVTHRFGYIARIDPRARILAAVVFSLIAGWTQNISALTIGLAAVMFAVVFSGLSITTLFKRLLPLNVLMLLLAILLPLSVPGETLTVMGHFHYSYEGLLLAGKIAMKGNAIGLAFLVLVGTMDINTMGHALRHLRVPEGLSHLMLFTVRYLEVLHCEYMRLRWAMKVRGFQPGMDRNTYRSFGNLLGMLLVRGYDRSERILAAMKCRGFQGRFYLLDHFSFQSSDFVFCSIAVFIMSAMIAVEFL
jgi:cobalt/nickel transport system permease protein